MQWATACPDWEDRILAGRSLIPFAPLFPAEADAALSLFKQLRLVDVAGSPTMGDACRPWVFDFVSHVFGSYDEEAGRRLITEFFLLISKKNSKSTSAAGIMLTALIRNWRKSAEFIIIAPTIEVANNSFFPARDMVREDDELSDLLHVQEHYRQITHRVTGATLKVIAADNETVGGKKATGVLVDELWIFGKRPNAENMLREATGGLASRPEGFVIYLTTQSDEAPAGVFREKLMYARGVRDGRVADKQFLPVLYEFPQHMVEAKKYEDMSWLYVTNPNMGASVAQDFLEREFRKAKETGAKSMCGFFAKHANVEIGLALLSDGWVGALYWQKAGDPSLTLDAILERSEVVDIGIDGGGLDDMLGITVIGRERGTQRLLTWSHAFVHPIALERRAADAPRYNDFQTAGDLTIVGDIGDDAVAVADIVERVYDAGVLDKIGVDPVGIRAIVAEIEARNVPEELVVGISQGWKMVGAIKETERKLAEGKLTHAAQPLMAWNVGNAKVEPRGNAIAITKQAAGAGKIDALMALFNAMELMSRNPLGVGSIWDDIGRRRREERERTGLARA